MNQLTDEIAILIQFMSISGSVGAGGRNHSLDVKAVQSRLNLHYGALGPHLAVDGRVGRLTIGRIKEFQIDVVKMRIADGRVDVGKKTLGQLNNGTAHEIWARARKGKIPAPTPKQARSNKQMNTGERLIQQQAAKAGWSKEFEEFRKEIIDKVIPNQKIFLGTIGRADDAYKVIAAWKQLRNWGLKPHDARRVMTAILGLRGYAPTMGVLDEIGKPVSKFGKILGKISKHAGRAGLIVTIIECVDHWGKGDYFMFASEYYKMFMGKAVPIAGIIEGLFSLLDGIFPGASKSPAYKIIRSFDPVGLGSVGVDAIATLALNCLAMLKSGKWDEARMYRLVDRMKKGPTAMFAEMGEDLGDATYEMSRWKTQDWKYAARQVPNWLLSLVKW